MGGKLMKWLAGVVEGGDLHDSVDHGGGYPKPEGPWHCRLIGPGCPPAGL